MGTRLSLRSHRAIASAARRLPSDDARKDAAEEIRDQASDTGDNDRKERLTQVALAIEAMCDSEYYRDDVKFSVQTTIEDHNEAGRRYDLLIAQMRAVSTDGMMNDAANWILDANLKHVTQQIDEHRRGPDAVLGSYLWGLRQRLDDPEIEYRRTGANPWETSGGGRVKSTGQSSSVDEYGNNLDYTRAGKKARATAERTVRHVSLDTPVTPAAPRDAMRALGWDRFGDPKNEDRVIRLDDESSSRKRKAEARQTSEYARQARRERRLGVGKK